MPAMNTSACTAISPSQADLEAWFTYYREVAENVACGFWIRGYDKDDLKGEGCIALFELLHSRLYEVLRLYFDEQLQAEAEAKSKMPPDDGYIAACVANYLKRLYRNRRPEFDDFELEHEYHDAEGSFTLLDVLDNGERSALDRAIDNQQRQMLYDAVALLPEIDRQVITLNAGLAGTEALPTREIAALLGLSKSNIARRVQRATEQLKACLN